MISAAAAYDQWHAQHVVDEAADAPWHRMVRARVDPDRDLAGKRVLEIGCGRGGFACWLSRHPARPAEVVAADFSAAAVGMGRGFATVHSIDRVTWTVANIEALDGFRTDFDTVFSCETIEHVPDAPRAVRELARVLRPGGRLFLTTPNYLSTIGLYRAYCRVRGRPFDECGQPICQLTMLPRTRAWVRAAGLRVVAVESAGQYLPFPGRPWIELAFHGRPRFLLRWLGHHSLIVAEKPVP
jgi:2-polyprenyl-3-methyl-5-hydroxy-6-metoxy-1,4-benzoquinol methylase